MTEEEQASGMKAIKNITVGGMADLLVDVAKAFAEKEEAICVHFRDPATKQKEKILLANILYGMAVELVDDPYHPVNHTRNEDIQVSILEGETTVQIKH